MIRLAIAALVVAGLSGCAEGRFVGGMQCMPDGSPVIYQYKNTQGTYDGAKASRENCMKN
tara:strand:+ start:239 stop:418 length:180 start_codon:yes stop_codon:yes gene_type:complete